MTEEQLTLFNKLTRLQQNVALAKVANPLISNVEAYKRGGGKANKNANSTAASASDILTNPNVVEFIESFAVERTKPSIMSRDEILERLTTMARTEVEDVVDIVTEERQLMDMATGEILEGQTFWALKSPERMTNGGMKAISELTATSQGLKIKLHDQRAAMKQIAELQGFDAAKQVELSGRNGGPITTVNVTDDELAEQLKDMGLDVS